MEKMEWTGKERSCQLKSDGVLPRERASSMARRAYLAASSSCLLAQLLYPVALYLLRKPRAKLASSYALAGELIALSNALQ